MRNATQTRGEEERMGSAATTTAASERTIGSSVPGKRILRAINPFVSTILRSPLHRMLSGRMMLLTFTGRETGKRYTIPVGYTREGDALLLFSSYSWYKNLRADDHVAMHLQGRKRTGRAEVIEERAAVVEAVQRLIEKYGLKETSSRTGLALDTDPPPTTGELARAMQGHVAIRVVPDPRDPSRRSHGERRSTMATTTTMGGAAGAVLAGLEGYRFLNLSTFRKSGVPVLTTVLFAVADDKVYVWTTRDSGKVKRIRNNATVRIAPSTRLGRPRGPMSAATARILPETEQMEAQALTNREFGWLKKFFGLI
jgi:PPOX class probable F420-dependent enzyme/deazaflavin-dependent oxidoreductase (nitroreductase family)